MRDAREVGGAPANLAHGLGWLDALNGDVENLFPTEDATGTLAPAPDGAGGGAGLRGMRLSLLWVVEGLLARRAAGAAGAAGAGEGTGDVSGDAEGTALLSRRDDPL